ncbi:MULTISPECIES: hypothetical protein [unclassified Ensifer]|nr:MULTISPECIES: hypothetical protein [unclassified Ensifer]
MIVTLGFIVAPVTFLAFVTILCHRQLLLLICQNIAIAVLFRIDQKRLLQAVRRIRLHVPAMHPIITTMCLAMRNVVGGSQFGKVFKAFFKQEFIMLRKLLVGAFLCVLVAPSAFAQSDITCNQAAMTKLETDVKAITDEMKKDYANKELAMAKQALASNDADKCKTHMSNAMKGNDPM